MKLRIQGRSLRLRLKPGEIAELAEHGRVEDRVELTPGSALVFAIQRSDVDSMAVQLEGSTITVLLSRAEVEQWTGTDLVGIEAQSPTESGNLIILVEKDFKCLHRPISGDDADAYPHPDA